MIKQLLAAFSGQPTRQPASPRGSKIAVGCGAVHHFIRQIHRDGIDRGAVASFGNTFEIEQTFSEHSGIVAGALMSVEKRVREGKREGTALYDSLVSLGESFAHASTSRPAFGLVIAVTDGKDISSTRFRATPTRAGEAYRRAIEASPNPILSVLIGVGSNDEIDHTALQGLARSGDMRLVTVENMNQLGNILANLGTQIQRGTVDRLITNGREAVLTRHHVDRVTVIPYDYAILMDRSGSMAENA